MTKKNESKEQKNRKIVLYKHSDCEHCRIFKGNVYISQEDGRPIFGFCEHYRSLLQSDIAFILEDPATSYRSTTPCPHFKKRGEAAV